MNFDLADSNTVLGFHKQGHLLHTYISPLPALFRFIPLPSHLFDPPHPITTVYRAVQRSTYPNNDDGTARYRNVLKRDSDEPLAHVFLDYILSNR